MTKGVRNFISKIQGYSVRSSWQLRRSARSRKVATRLVCRATRNFPTMIDDSLSFSLFSASYANSALRRQYYVIKSASRSHRPVVATIQPRTREERIYIRRKYSWLVSASRKWFLNNTLYLSPAGRTLPHRIGCDFKMLQEENLAQLIWREFYRASLEHL